MRPQRIGGYHVCFPDKKKMSTLPTKHLASVDIDGEPQDYVVEFDFLGKDSMRYHNFLPVSKVRVLSLMFFGVELFAVFRETHFCDNFLEMNNSNRTGRFKT